MTDLKALLEAEANATPPPPIDTTATIVRIAQHRRRRTAMIAGAAAIAVAATATFSFGNTGGEIPTAAPPTTTPDLGTPATPGTERPPLGRCGKPVAAQNQPLLSLRMTLVSARIEDKDGPWRIIAEVKVTNHSAQTLSGTTGRGPHTMAAAMGNAFAFGGQFSSLEAFKLAPGESAIYGGVMVLGDCINAMDSSLGQTYQIYAEQTFNIDGRSYTVRGGPWDFKK